MALLNNGVNCRHWLTECVQFIFLDSVYDYEPVSNSAHCVPLLYDSVFYSVHDLALFFQLIGLRQH